MRWTGLAGRLAGALVETLFPLPEPGPGMARLEAPFCGRCAQPYKGDIQGAFVCSNCDGLDWHLGRARAAYLSRGPVREAVHRFKYDREFWMRRYLGAWLVEGFRAHYRVEEFDAVAPVPLHAVRRRWREFNQAAVLARALGAAVGLPVRDWLVRRRETEVQARLDREERRGNVRGAFVLAKGADAAKRRVLMVDDVFTTGSTVNECARVLLEAGAASVDALAVARG